MSKHLIARIIMLPNGAVHIALLSKETVNCSRNNLLEFLSDPHEFLIRNKREIKKSTCIVNPRHRYLESIPGLTLLKAYSDNSVVCRFPKLFDALFKNIDNDSDKPFNLKEHVLGLEFSDEKHFLMKFFYDFTNEPRSELVVDHALQIEPDEQNEIMSETFNTVFNSIVLHTVEETPEPQPLEPTIFKTLQDSNLITVAEYAALHDKKESTVSGWIYNKKVPHAVKQDNKWYLPKDFNPSDGRSGRIMPKRNTKGIEKYITPADSYTELQNRLKREEAISDKLREFIRSYEELSYYKKHRYCEVCWDGKPALIIDINPDYYCERLGLTNRQIIRERNENPVVPDRDDKKYIIHHIGQKANSPFAIIPEDDHAAGNQIFHLHAEPGNSEALHNASFEAQKRSFWNRYLDEYDKYGTFVDIERTDLCHGADKKRRANREKEISN